MNVLATKRFGGKVAKPKSETGRMAGQPAVCITALTVEKSLEVQAKVDGGNIGGGGQEREGKGGGDVPPRRR